MGRLLSSAFRDLNAYLTLPYSKLFSIVEPFRRFLWKTTHRCLSFWKTNLKKFYCGRPITDKSFIRNYLRSRWRELFFWWLLGAVGMRKRNPFGEENLYIFTLKLLKTLDLLLFISCLSSIFTRFQRSDQRSIFRGHGEVTNITKAVLSAKKAIDREIKFWQNVKLIK